MPILVSVFMPILFLTQANHQTAVACGAAMPAPDEKNEIENDNKYEKAHEAIRVHVLVLRSLSLTLKNGEGIAELQPLVLGTNSVSAHIV
jgi:hypothetical protein